MSPRDRVPGAVVEIDLRAGPQEAAQQVFAAMMPSLYRVASQFCPAQRLLFWHALMNATAGALMADIGIDATKALVSEMASNTQDAAALLADFADPHLH